MENNLKAREILDYLLAATQVVIEKKQYEEMAKEIEYLIETD
jgi:hypothetical protein